MPTKDEVNTAEVNALTIKTISEIVNQLIAAYDRGEQINLTKLKQKIAA